MSIHRLALLTSFMTFGLIVFGGFVVSTGSGMGCGPEWPLCNGAVIPELSGATLIEFAHRVIALIVQALSALLMLKILRENRSVIQKNVAIGMMGTLLVQILLGAIVVFLHVPAIIVTIHLIVAMVYLASLIWIWRYSKPTFIPYHNEYRLPLNRQKRMKYHLNIVLTMLLFTFGIGGYIKHQHGVNRNAFEWLFLSKPIPQNMVDTLEAVHFVLAAVAAVYIFTLTVVAFKNGWGEKIENRFALTSIIVFVQAVIGLVMIWFEMPVSLAVLHLAFATLIFAIIVESRITLDILSDRKIENINQIG
ncbi:COX15/CtaA family protein [Bacillus shivajii]|uniref:COX15/CtaA family protein n=1 Tax=Bacillus shivajii TaxID=1983719 RepID=UPI001CF9BB23|nr:COX15/CtaA family protein [Bacillus shivajii]UCZ53179.1 COX15/CtaA family protein [Bacillus shivajii]